MKMKRITDVKKLNFPVNHVAKLELTGVTSGVNALHSKQV